MLNDCSTHSYLGLLDVQQFNLFVIGRYLNTYTIYYNIYVQHTRPRLWGLLDKTSRSCEYIIDDILLM